MTLKVAQLWVGHFPSQDQFGAFVGEDPAFWHEDNQDKDWPLKTPLSAFIGSQDQWWYDHDFLEATFNDAAGSLEQRFPMWGVRSWGYVAEQRLADLGVTKFNAVIMFHVMNDYFGKPERQVPHPRSCTTDQVQVHYLGEVQFDDSEA